MDEQDVTELYQNLSSGLESTIDNQLDAHQKLNQRAVDLGKINLLSASVVVAGASVSNIQPSLLAIATILTFCYALWSCFRVYHPTRLDRGINIEALREAEEMARNKKSKKEINRRIAYTYGEVIQEFNDEYRIEKDRFVTALWSSVTALMFLSTVIVIEIAEVYNISLQVLALFVVPMVGIWGRDMYSDTRH